MSFEKLPEWEVWRRYGIRVARPERAVFDEMRRQSRREAVVVLESALAGRITSLERFGAYAATHRSARRFVAEVDSAVVLVNASTRFTDGGEVGFGAEIGISTQKLHARGPLGLPEMTTTKYVVTGDGHVR